MHVAQFLLLFMLVHRAETFDEDVWNGCVDEKIALPLFAAIGFFNRLKAANIEVVFSFGRPENQCNATSANHISASYEGWIVQKC